MRVRTPLPDDVFDAVEHSARRSGRHRSAIHADALRDYLTRHDPDWVTRAYDRVLDAVGDSEEKLAL
jgi:predicted transcriptional regulator